MSLKTDRGLHVDAQICHRLLSYLAQKKRLKEVQVCSGYYSLQSIQGGDLLQLIELCTWSPAETMLFGEG